MHKGVKDRLGFFHAKVKKGPDCWGWQGHLVGGYGKFSIRWEGKTRSFQAHRIMWELIKGVEPKGELDHLCRNRKCINPDHLEDVAHHTNVLRGMGNAAVNARKKRCPCGRRYDRVWSGFRRGHIKTQRSCSFCSKKRSLKWHYAHQEEANRKRKERRHLKPSQSL